MNEFEIRAQHLSSSDNRIADYLSRWKSDVKSFDQFAEMTRGVELLECVVVDDDFKLQSDW